MPEVMRPFISRLQLDGVAKCTEELFEAADLAFARSGTTHGIVLFECVV